jgi:hypothetical protein
MTAQRHQTDINLDPVFEALVRPLALIDSPERRDEMQRFAAASRGYQERAIFDLLSSVTGAINDANTGARVTLEYRNGGLGLAVEAEREDAPAEADAEELASRMGGELERLSLRLPSQIKKEIDSAADQQGVSVNSWCVRALARVAFGQTQGRRGDPRGRTGGDDRSGRGPWRGGRSRIIIDTDAFTFPGAGMFGQGRGRRRSGPGEFEPEGAPEPKREPEQNPE